MNSRNLQATRAEGAVQTTVRADVPDDVIVLHALDGADYTDCFAMRAPRARRFSPEEWARATLERAPLAHQSARMLWRSIGLRLGPPGSPDHVQGWKITAREPDWLRIETRSWYLTAEAVCVVRDSEVCISVSLRYDRRIVAAAVWGLIERPHLRAVPVMMRQANALLSP